MPFPARKMHSLSHVRYTPHAFWIEDGRDPYAVLDAYDGESRANRMGFATRPPTCLSWDTAG